MFHELKENCETILKTRSMVEEIILALIEMEGMSKDTKLLNLFI